jgi:hypothetical protein
MPAHAHTIADPGHIHTTSQSNHSHGVSDGWHAHSVSEGSGHTHGVADPQHVHPLNSTQIGIEYHGGSFQTVQIWPYPTDGTYLAATNISIARAVTGLGIVAGPSNIGIAGATAIISVDPHVTGITGTNNTGGGGGAANVCQPSIVFSKIIKT